jgi:hypothetical protein
VGSICVSSSMFVWIRNFGSDTAFLSARENSLRLHRVERMGMCLYLHSMVMIQQGNSINQQLKRYTVYLVMTLESFHPWHEHKQDRTGSKWEDSYVKISVMRKVKYLFPSVAGIPEILFTIWITIILVLVCHTNFS